ncbi:bZIP transcription factor TGA10-like isoform X2 [Zingiber officinale]|uniref:bZIP transcription factor TGA10-like isoform X2 n=1 Tax=Zingiber officinale TaxID=94328 RepID=UPI001C4BD903|nr:bZIP transcription factor TGA10-like isoform X2 [Zingiber officinale]
MADEADATINSSNQLQQRQQNMISSFAATLLPSSSSSSAQSMHGSFSMKSKETGVYDLGELDQSLFMYLDGQDHLASPQEQRQTLNIFPSRPMHEHPSTKGGLGLASQRSGGSQKSSELDMNTTNIKDDSPSVSERRKDIKASVIKEGSRKGTSTEHEGPKIPDPKILRRLAQNREAARKSRLRKKAYIQQLESSRIKLTQLEHELQRARTQGLLLGGGAVLGDQGLPTAISGLSSEAAMFDMEYLRWLDEQQRATCELRVVVQEHLPDSELQMFVDSCLAHLCQLTQLKGLIIKSDVFHLISGTWLTPAERCFMWIAGFRPSDLIKMVLRHIEPLTEQQIMGVCVLQQSAQETEEALSHGLEALSHSVSNAIASGELSCTLNVNVADYMGQMAVAMDKLAAIEGFVRQAENLRQQTLQRLQEMLTTRQMARSLLAVAEYFHRLRALSSLWLSRPRQQDYNS